MSETSARDTKGVDRGHSQAGAPPRPSTYVAQVMAELRKVHRPTQRELIVYTIVVLVFVLIVMGYVVGLDQIFTRVVDFVFGG
ncbi:preprotein translocase subunit SecE [Ornithinimicrobium sp. F0845]|uniref:preprotein translocase subunit SecE n=1 Tax=Ornithinimicrobium sp. F0845 TaxID=2926412 RepID=UPI001FF56D85|nr:preprotein translocase subunit SecE [Ornithinimicrobium sp. F0845]